MCNWWLFCGLLLFQVVTEWLQYPLRATKTYWDAIGKLSKCVPECLKHRTLQLLAFDQQRFTSNDWASFMVIQFAARSYVAFFSILAYAWGYTMLYIQQNARLDHAKYVDTSRYQILMTQLYSVRGRMCEYVGDGLVVPYKVETSRRSA